MLWLIVLAIVGLLAVVLFRKPAINNVGISYTPSVQLTPSQIVQPPMGTPVLPAPRAIDTFDFNDLFSANKPAPSDRPQA